MNSTATARLALCLLLAGCGAEASESGADPAGQEEGPRTPYGFEVWHADFPGAPDHPHLSMRHPGLRYGRSRREALEQVALNLAGNCTREGWQFAKQMFARVDDEDLGVLIRLIDRGLQVKESADIVENVVEAMGYAERPILAEALLRALEHPKQAVRNKVLQSMVWSGTAETVRRAFFAFPYLEAKGRNAWIRAAVAHLGVDSVEYFQRILGDPNYAPHHDKVIEAAVTLPPERALEVFDAYGGEIPQDYRPTVAGLRHATGDVGGTLMVREYMQRKAPELRLHGIASLRFGNKELLTDTLIELTREDPDAEVRAAALNALADIPGEVVTSAIENMLLDESPQVRQLTLGVLLKRGRRDALDDLIAVVKTGTGTKVRLAMQDLVAAKDGKATEAIAERMRAAPRAERREYLRAIALTTAPEAFGPLSDVFLSDDPEWRDLRSLACYHFLNARGAEREVLAMFQSLPPSDYQRRGLLLSTLSGIANDREDPELAKELYGALREVVADREEIPQMRLAALEYLRNDLDLDDMLTIKRMLDSEEPSMRAALSDFLFEFF